MHWNLPSNPVDLEQREGRGHRYKGHAVRKNIAEHYGLSALLSLAESADPWAQLFALAASQRKENIKFKRLKRELALYRIVFGQPRQEDLLFGLKHSGDESLTDMTQWLISLEPPKV